MNERWLQYIWQFQHYNTNELRTTEGEKIRIIHLGQFNTNQGPDFLNAKLQIGPHTLVGNVELHVLASDWFRHKHDKDPHYHNVILHVVWEDDLKADAIKRFPTLVLENRVPRVLLSQHARWQKSQNSIPCGRQLLDTSELVWKQWKERLLVERLGRKKEMLLQWLDKNNADWEEILWWVIARSYGIPVNGDAFLAIAASVPWRIMQRHAGSLIQVEAMLFGQAGLLDDDVPDDDYFNKLKEEYGYLRGLHAFERVNIPVLFLRMRPSSFPTVRLAQLATMIHHTAARLRSLIESDSFKTVKRMLGVPADGYWNDHYIFGEVGSMGAKKPGGQMIDNILINAVVPFMFAFGEYHANHEYISRAIEWMHQLRAENNHAIRHYLEMGVGCKSAADTQALLELKLHYCNTRRCLECAVGVDLLQRTKT